MGPRLRREGLPPEFLRGFLFAGIHQHIGQAVKRACMAGVQPQDSLEVEPRLLGRFDLVEHAGEVEMNNGMVGKSPHRFAINLEGCLREAKFDKNYTKTYIGGTLIEILEQDVDVGLLGFLKPAQPGQKTGPLELKIERPRLAGNPLFNLSQRPLDFPMGYPVRHK